MAESRTNSSPSSPIRSGAGSQSSSAAYSVTAGGRVVVDTRRLMRSDAFREIGRLAAEIVKLSNPSKG